MRERLLGSQNRVCNTYWYWLYLTLESTTPILLTTSTDGETVNDVRLGSHRPFAEYNLTFLSRQPIFHIPISQPSSKCCPHFSSLTTGCTTYLQHPLTSCCFPTDRFREQYLLILVPAYIVFHLCNILPFRLTANLFRMGGLSPQVLLHCVVNHPSSSLSCQYSVAPVLHTLALHVHVTHKFSSQ